MGHFFGFGESQYFVGDDGAVYVSADSNVKLADSEEEFRAKREPKPETPKTPAKKTVKKKEKKETIMMTCKKCGKENLKGKAGLTRHMKTHGYKGKGGASRSQSTQEK